MPDVSVTKKILDDLRYTSTHDVKMRLSDTIVRYGDTPVYVRGSWSMPNDPDGLHIQCLDLVLGEHFICHSSDVNLDISSLPLGWVDYHETPFFLSRGTASSQKQGVYLGHVFSFDPSYMSTNRGFGWDSFRDLDGLVRCVSGEYSSIKVIASRPLGGALHRDWALTNPRFRKDDRVSPKHLAIYHKAIEVGTFIKDENTFFFRKGRLTKTRKIALQEMFYNPINQGVRYAISEQA